MLLNIDIAKPKAKRILSPPPSKKRKSQDPRVSQDRQTEPLTEMEMDVLADITNGNCGIVSLLRKPVPVTFTNNLSHPSEFVTVITEPHQQLPPTLIDVRISDEGFDEFMDTIKLSDAEIDLIQLSTRNQADSGLWFQYRKNRITASKFKNAVLKVNDDICQ